MIPRKRKLQLEVEGNIVEVIKVDGNQYISLTNLSLKHGGDQSIYSWMRNRNTIEFLGIWETLNNPNFKGYEFDTFRKQAGLNSFNMTPRKWITTTNAMGITSKAGRYGGTFAHSDIAFEFATWISPIFKLLLIKEFQTLKSAEKDTDFWDSRRYLSSVNYKLQTLAIKENIIPSTPVPVNRHGIVYANEADLLNVIVFGMTKAAWSNQNPKEAKKGLNPRDTASAEELVILANLESLNSMLIEQKQAQPERLNILSEEATRQRNALLKTTTQNKTKK